MSTKSVKRSQESKQPTHEYIIILPNIAIYLKYFFDCISEKKIQIHQSYSDQVKITMITSCYFPPQEIIEHLTKQLPEAMIKMHGMMRFKDRVKRTPRPYRWGKKNNTAHAPKLNLEDE